MARLNGKDKGILEHPKGSGKWWVRIYVNGREKRYMADNKTQAKAFYGRLKADIREGRYFPEKYEHRPTFLKDYMKECIAANTKRTIREDRRYAKFWDSQFPNRTLDHISPSEIEKVRKNLIDDGRSVATANRYLAFLRTTYYRALRDKKAKENPVAKIRFYKESPGRVRFVSEGEEARLHEVIGGEHWAKVVIALNTGLRQAEQFKLKWDQIDFENRLLTIPRSKSGEVRHVPLSDDVLSILRGFSSWMTSPWVFPSENAATPLDPRNFCRRVFLPCLKKARIEGVTWHM